MSLNLIRRLIKGARLTGAEYDHNLDVLEEAIESIEQTPGNDGRELELRATETHIQWRYVGDTAWTDLVPIDAIASSSYEAQLGLHQAGISNYIGQGPIRPIVTDEYGNLILGFNGQEVQGLGLLNDSSINESIKTKLFGGSLLAEYTGNGPVHPIVTDRDGNIVIGFDSEKQQVLLAGAGAAATQLSASQPLVDPPIAKGINHVIAYGQSLSVGSTATPAISTTQPYSNITFDAGPRANNNGAYDYAPFRPLTEFNDSVEPLGETICSGAANFALTLAAIQNGITPSSHVILASSAGQGGAGINGLKKGSAQYNNVFLDHITEAYALNSNHAVHAVFWLQGETDQQGSGGNPPTTYADYRQLLQQLQVDIENDVQGVNNQTSPVYVITYQTPSRVKMNAAAIQRAQLDLAQKSALFSLAAPCYHMPFSDGTHLTAAGYKWLGAYFGRAYKELVFDRIQPRFLNPLWATVQGRVVRVRFDVPTAPLLFDTSTLAPTTDLGFVVASGDALTTAIVRSGATATATTSTAHGLTTGQRVVISGARQPEYSGVFTVAVVNSTTFSFQVEGTPESPATGTIVTRAAQTIEQIGIDGSDVILTLTAAPSGAVAVRYALDYLGVGLSITSGASGNLRDSTPETVTVSGVARPLYHLCPHFELPATSLEA
jgi:hypothetical protein